MKITYIPSILTAPQRQIKADDFNFIQENIIGITNEEIDTFVSTTAENVFETATETFLDKLKQLFGKTE